MNNTPCPSPPNTTAAHAKGSPPPPHRTPTRPCCQPPQDAAANGRLGSATYQRLLLGVVVKSAGYLAVFGLVRQQSMKQHAGRCLKQHAGHSLWHSCHPHASRRVWALAETASTQVFGMPDRKTASTPSSYSPHPLHCTDHPQASKAWTPLVCALYPTAALLSIGLAATTLVKATARSNGVAAALPGLLQTSMPQTTAGWVYRCVGGTGGHTSATLGPAAWGAAACNSTPHFVHADPFSTAPTGYAAPVHPCQCVHPPICGHRCECGGVVCVRREGGGGLVGMRTVVHGAALQPGCLLHCTAAMCDHCCHPRLLTSTPLPLSPTTTRSRCLLCP